MNSTFDDETLVSYLDGELPSEAAARIERGISDDPGLRERIDALRHTWDILDELPETQPSSDLAQTTIEMVALSIGKEEKTFIQKVVGNRLLMLGLMCVLFAVIGAISGRVISGFLDDNFIENLPAVTLSNSLRATKIHDGEWLEEVAEFDNLLTVGEYLIKRQNVKVNKPIGDGLVPEKRSERRAWLDELSTIEATRLRNSFDEWVRNTPVDDRDKMKGIAEQVFSGDETKTAKLLEALQAYEAVLDSGGSRFSTSMDEASPEERRTLLKEQIATLMGERYTYHISDRDADAIFDWIDEIRFEDYGYFQGGAMQIFQEIIEPAESSRISDERLSDLCQAFSQPTQRLLGEIDPRKHRNIVGSWFYAVVDEDSVLNTTSYEDLSAEFENSLPEEAHAIELLPEPYGRERLAERMGVAKDTSEN